jgi:hypothetical protein
MATPKRPSVRRKSLSDQKPWEDEVLQDVCAVRDSYAAEHGFNLDLCRPKTPGGEQRPPVVRLAPSRLMRPRTFLSKTFRSLTTDSPVPCPPHASCTQIPANIA